MLFELKFDISINLLQQIMDLVNFTNDNKCILSEINLVEEFTVSKLIIQFLLNVLFHIEYPTNLLLILVKKQASFMGLLESFEGLNSHFLIDVSIIKAFSAFKGYCAKLLKPINDIIIRIKEEGADLKYTQDTEVL